MQSILCTEFRKNCCQMISRLSYILTATISLLMNAIEKLALSRLDEFVTSRDNFQLVNEFGFIIYRLYICTHSLKLNPFFTKCTHWLHFAPIEVKMNPLGFCILFIALSQTKRTCPCGTSSLFYKGGGIWNREKIAQQFVRRTKQSGGLFVG